MLGESNVKLVCLSLCVVTVVTTLVAVHSIDQPLGFADNWKPQETQIEFDEEEETEAAVACSSWNECG